MGISLSLTGSQSTVGPQQFLGASLLGYWDAEDASTITQSGGLVSSWRDKVAGYDAVQALGASKPVYSATSFNSRPGLSFDGTDDELTLGSVPFPVNADASEFWLLVDQQAAVADTTVRYAFGYGDTQNASRRSGRTVVTGVNRGLAVTGTGAANVQLSPPGDLTGRHVIRQETSGTATTISQDGTASAPSAAVPATTNVRTRIGAASVAPASLFWQGQIAAVLVTSALSADQAAQLLVYLKARGGIA